MKMYNYVLMLMKESAGPRVCVCVCVCVLPLSDMVFVCSDFPLCSPSYRYLSMPCLAAQLTSVPAHR